MRFQSEFSLNREHLQECYDESLPFSKNKTPRYKFMALLIAAAIAIFIFTDDEDILGYFLLALVIVEWFSFRYRRAWWLTRQVWSRNSGNTIHLIIDDKGIEIKSVYNNSQLLWGDIANVEETSKGLLLIANNGGSHYISKSTISEQAKAFIIEHTQPEH
ncbi:YcxB family protein [Psychromonas sp. MME2]|uniref:YcxB family protein n=1 Tax=unclassified Psychromonas TaxID=2614957 RepID=UPI00339C90E8